MFNDMPPEPQDEKPEDVFDDMAEELNALQRRLMKLGPKSTSNMVRGVTVLTALLAWFVSPVGGVASLATLGLGGYGGSRLGSKLRNERQAALPAAIAELILVGARSATPPRLP